MSLEEASTIFLYLIYVVRPRAGLLLLITGMPGVQTNRRHIVRPYLSKAGVCHYGRRAKNDSMIRYMVQTANKKLYVVSGFYLQSSFLSKFGRVDGRRVHIKLFELVQTLFMGFSTGNLQLQVRYKCR